MRGAVLAAGLAAQVVCALVIATVVPAQAQQLGQIITPILTIDRDALFSGTLYGKRVAAELEAESAALRAETTQIETALEAEEKELTAQRETLSNEEFRNLANAFDEKVQALRAEREQAQTTALKRIEDAQAEFFNQIGGILGQVVRERGAVAIVDRRAVLLTAADIDITQAAIERIDALIGDGSTLDDTAGDPPAPEDDATSQPADTATPGDGADSGQ